MNQKSRTDSQRPETSIHTRHIPGPLALRKGMSQFLLLCLMLLALAHGLAYVFIIPIWQAPDEPTLYEYTALVASLGRIPAAEERDPALEERIVASMDQHRFWHYIEKPEPATPIHTLADIQQHFTMPRQAGADPPLYFALAALPLRLAQSWSIEHQVTLLRILNALLLPVLVAIAYAAAREVTIDDSQNIASIVPFATAALVALQPMLATTSASVSNDGLANLFGAALCWIVLRIVRRGISLRRIALSVGLLGLALLTKRTTLPYLELALVAGTIHVVWKLRAGKGDSHSAYYRWSLTVSSALCVLLCAVWFVQQFEWRTAAGWLDARSEQAAPRSWPTGEANAALRLNAGEEVIQPLPAVATDLLRSGTLRWGAHIWGDREASGRLIVYTGDQRQEFPFKLNHTQTPQARALIPRIADNVRLGLVADSGWFYADNLWATVSGLSGNLLVNGDLNWPSLHASSPLQEVTSYLQLSDLVWVVQSGRLEQPLPRLDEWASLLFASFWGHFGWMHVPFVLGSPWLPLLAIASLSAVVGSAGLRIAQWGTPQQRRQVLVLLLLLLLAFATLTVNAYTRPTELAFQQGRYLFPVIVPLAILMALGQSALLPGNWRRIWLGGWAGFWLVFAAAAMLRLVEYYA